MGLIANQMLMEALYKLSEKRKEKKSEKAERNNKNESSKRNRI